MFLFIFAPFFFFKGQARFSLLVVPQKCIQKENSNFIVHSNFIEQKKNRPSSFTTTIQ